MLAIEQANAKACRADSSSRPLRSTTRSRANTIRRKAHKTSRHSWRILRCWASSGRSIRTLRRREIPIRTTPDWCKFPLDHQPGAHQGRQREEAADEGRQHSSGFARPTIARATAWRNWPRNSASSAPSSSTTTRRTARGWRTFSISGLHRSWAARSSGTSTSRPTSKTSRRCSPRRRASIPRSFSTAEPRRRAAARPQADGRRGLGSVPYIGGTGSAIRSSSPRPARRRTARTTRPPLRKRRSYPSRAGIRQRL